MRVLVVDDEPIARRRLARMLQSIAGVTVVGAAQDGLDAISQCQQHKPDLLVLDVEMPSLDGITLAQRVKPLPLLLYVTAHSTHAVAAFDVHAVDYLLKPVQQERLERAIERARERLERAAQSEGSPAKTQEGSPRVVSQIGGVTRLFDAGEVVRFWAKDKCTLFIARGQEFICDESLDSLEARLSKEGFVRAHRAELINARRVKALHHQGGSTHVELDDGTRVVVSRRALAVVKSALGL
jgi:DNA-binding LytR/AlgR family response regulator